MPCIRIKQLEDRVATMGVHMGGDQRRRKLEPGEVVDIPESEKANGESLLDLLLDTDRVELCRAKPTRPLDYETVSEAKLCSPSFSPQDESEEVAAGKARAKVAERLAAVEEPPKQASEPEAPVAEVETPLETPNVNAASRRALRRQTLGGENGAPATT